MKKKGFTLIELVVVVAIILLLAATLAPKLRKEVAKARDAKAVAALGTMRTAVNIFYADEGDAATNLYGAKAVSIINSASADSEFLEDNVVTFILNSGDTADAATALYVDAGASTTNADKDGLVFGGEVSLDYDAADITVTLNAGAATNDYDTKGNAWASY